MRHEDSLGRLEDLLADEATQGLDAAETAALEALLATSAGYDRESLARVAAQVAGVTAAGGAGLPAALRARVEADAERVLGGTIFPAAAPARVVPLRRRSAWVPAAVAGWLAAAAGWLLVVLPAPAPSPETATQASVAAARAALLASAADAVRIEWKATEDPAAAGASGDVVWSDALQQGYMRFRGLAANDPGVSQYQLWIFDAARDERYPVDGGIFDVPAAGEVIVPIRARLPIDAATLFAVTIERPGGVVVSSRERLPLVAAVRG